MIKHNTIDRVGFTASLICSLHCVLTPIILLTLPYFGMMFWANETFEKGFIGISAILALCSICYGYTRHRVVWIFIPLSIGMVVLLTGIFYHEHNNYGALRSAFGGLLLSFSHFCNIKMCKTCITCKH